MIGGGDGGWMIEGGDEGWKIGGRAAVLSGKQHSDASNSGREQGVQVRLSMSVRLCAYFTRMCI